MPKPPWLKIRPPGQKFFEVKNLLGGLSLNTICVSAKCPNMSECWSHGTATFLVMGSSCTRGCRFCAVQKKAKGDALDSSEPARVVEAAKRLSLSYVVLTSVTRDDLPDQGAGHFASCIRELKKNGFRAEALIPDFQGRKDLLETVLSAKPDVLAHNIEVVERLTPSIRDRRANYKQSLSVLANAKKISPSIYTKSSIMLGLGETDGEVLQAMDDLRAAGCDFLTLGQYLQPSPKNAPVKEFVPPEKFAMFKERALEKGFSFVASSPFVRSSFKASDALACMG